MTQVKTTQSQYIEQILYFFLGVLEVLLVFRFILKLMGASQASSFVQFIYGTSKIFIFPFEGIFRRAVTQGIEVSAVIEPANMVAIIVYAVLVWGIVSFIKVLSGKAQSE
ncbi:MAG: YggT family protein [Candidatus Pacebacteria bacterium CG10_big_fil_rev_8_21_14_0_10_36_11]|nr:MAG: YggT family protein [Candidatus Pacebacteria bacterium CG2_30_36_39]PIR65044.1 MAG: YggT family protein [Candidatus Pacebacteria bacterium CG10_big_fil_rev_8_21_14_0_10_36_11]PJC42329.1 MAG: YggT family protein [Candidatus Pacebacteria bacterium CG_4_9_14_0_2_um_filter_36_8]